LPKDELVLQSGVGGRVSSAAGMVGEWAEAALGRYPDGLVLIAGDGALPDSLRWARLHEVRAMIVEAGFHADRVRCASDALPEPDEGESEGATSTLRFKVISGRQAELEVRSIATLMAGTRPPREPACTSTS